MSKHDEDDWGLERPGSRFPARRPSLATSLFDALVARGHAHAVSHAARSELMVLRARQEVAQARCRTEEAEAELEDQRWWRTLPHAEKRKRLQEDVEVQELLLERDRVIRQRLDPYGAPPLVPPSQPAAALPSQARLEPEPEQLDVEKLAQTVSRRLDALPPAQRGPWQERFEQELRRRATPAQADAVLRRIAQLRRRGAEGAW